MSVRYFYFFLLLIQSVNVLANESHLVGSWKGIDHDAMIEFSKNNKLITNIGKNVSYKFEKNMLYLFDNEREYSYTVTFKSKNIVEFYGKNNKYSHARYTYVRASEIEVDEWRNPEPKFDFHLSTINKLQFIVQFILVLALIFLVYYFKRNYWFLIPTILLTANTLILLLAGENIYRYLYFLYEIFCSILGKKANYIEYYELRPRFASTSGYLAIAIGVALITFRKLHVWVWFACTYFMVMISALVFLYNIPGMGMYHGQGLGAFRLNRDSAQWLAGNIFIVSLFLALPKALEQAWKKLPKDEEFWIFLRPIQWFLSKNAIIGSILVLLILIYNYFFSDFSLEQNLNRNYLAVSGLILIILLSWDKFILLTPLSEKLKRSINED